METVNGVDVFVSYQTDSLGIVMKIVDAIEKNGIRCWYAPRNIGSGSYGAAICDGIEKCKVFLLVLTDKASNSVHVLNEVEMAYKRLEKGVIIMPFKITEEITNQEMNYYICRQQWVNAVNVPLENAINELLSKIKPMFGIDNRDSHEKVFGNLKATTRDTNAYFDFEDSVEVERLKCEGDLLFNIESSIYDKLLFGRNEQNVLDVNVLYAGNQIKRLYRKEVKSYIGLTYNEQAANKYNELYPQEDSRFYYIDLNDPYFDRNIRKYMAEMNVSGFDLINLSMVILDLKDPSRVLQKLRRFLNPNGMMYIRDIDDGLNLYYPDNDNLFKKYFDLADADRFAGFRKSGRQIYSYLREIGAKEINVELSGLDNTKMDFPDKEKFFQTYFTFLSHEYERLVKENPKNEDYLKANNWLKKNMPIIEEEFFDSDFFFIGGFIIYTARF